jgi:hypothetical protein
MGHPSVEGHGMIAARLVALLVCAATLAAERFHPAGDGIAVLQERTPEPWSVHVVRIDRSRRDLSLRPSLAFHDGIGLNELSGQIGLFPAAQGRVEAAINGDFYATEHDRMPGDPRGLFIADGELASAPIDRDCFWIAPDGTPRIGAVAPRFTISVAGAEPLPLGLNAPPDDSRTMLYTAAASRALAGLGEESWRLAGRDGAPPGPLRAGATFQGVVAGRAGDAAIRRGEWRIVPDAPLRPALRRGAAVTIRTHTEPSLDGVTTAIGGGPALLAGGKPTAMRANKSRERHPRSAIGWNTDHFFLVVVDGRQPGLSVGMTLPELAGRMLALGCSEAMNLDGGGSAELILDGRILNSPCYGHERATATSLLVVRRPGDRASK